MIRILSILFQVQPLEYAASKIKAEERSIFQYFAHGKNHERMKTFIYSMYMYKEIEHKKGSSDWNPESICREDMLAHYHPMLPAPVFVYLTELQQY